MKITGNKIGFALLGIAYLVSAFVVARRWTQEATSDKVTLRISQWQLEGGVRQSIDAIIRRYEELNPNVHVIQLAVPGGSTYLPWIQSQMVGEVGPDLVEYSWPWPDTARNFSPITAEVMQPNPYNRGTPLEGVPWRDTFIDGMTSPDNYVQTLSQYYGISMTTGIHRIVYNRALVKKITGHETAPRNYREFLALCDQITAYAKAHGLKLAPLANSRTSHINLTNEIVGNTSTRLYGRVDFLHRLKLEPLELAIAYTRGEWSYDSPEIAASFQVLKEFGEVCTPGFLQRERDSALTDFVSGRAAMVLAPSWESSSLLEICPFEIGAFRFPTPREDDPVYGHYTRGPFSEGQILTGMPFYLNRRTPHRAEALDFLRFMSSYEGSSIFTRVSSWLPVVVGVKPSEFTAQFQIQAEGYNWYGGFLGPSNHIDCQNFVLSKLYALWGNDGSADKFRQVLRDGMGVPVRDGLRRDVLAGLENTRREDCAAAARLALAASGQPPEVLSLVTLGNETKLYQARGVLAEPVKVAQASAAESGTLQAGAPALRPAATQP
jgi:raffinose/stachyose/melibiose transport system substrate-binding protein